MQAQKNIRFKPVANQGPQPFPDVDGRTWRPESEWTWQWYGSNIQTDCGLKITKTVRYDNGEWMFAFANADGGFYLYVKGKMAAVGLNSSTFFTKINLRIFSYFSAPPELITFYHQPGYIPEPGSDFTSGSVQFQLTSPDMVKSYNATCFAKSARPEAQVTWFIGNEQVRQYYLSRTFFKIISIKLPSWLKSLQACTLQADASVLLQASLIYSTCTQFFCIRLNRAFL